MERQRGKKKGREKIWTESEDMKEKGRLQRKEREKEWGRENNETEERKERKGDEG